MVIDFVVDRLGVPRFVHVARTTDVVFDQSAVETVAGWRFRPGLSRGKPCDTEMEIPIVFQSGR